MLTSSTKSNLIYSICIYMCFKSNYFQLENIFTNAFKMKRFLKCFVYMCIYNSNNDNKMEV